MFSLNSILTTLGIVSVVAGLGYFLYLENKVSSLKESNANLQVQVDILTSQKKITEEFVDDLVDITNERLANHNQLKIIKNNYKNLKHVNNFKTAKLNAYSKILNSFYICSLNRHKALVEKREQDEKIFSCNISNNDSEL